ncbi:MAG: polysaccharide biosynthesis tyrosine autokinase [Novosphingobium sp.]|nr:polysaccharide biosynthesis tyrosine autokinase [Novosphingobium sp.]
MNDNTTPDSAIRHTSAITWADRYLPSSGYAYGDSAGLFDLNSLMGILFRQRYLITATIGAVLLLGLIVTLLTKPTYLATASVVVDPEPTNIVNGQDLQPALYGRDMSTYLNTTADILKSRKMALQVIDALPPAVLKALTEAYELDTRPDDISEKAWPTVKRNILASILKSSVRAEVPFDTRILTIGYSFGDPKIAAAVANAYAENLMLDDVRRGQEANAYALKYLRGQIDETRGKLQDAELAANAYARQNAIISEWPIATANLASVNTTYTEARARRVTAEQHWKAVAALPASQLPEIQQSDIVQPLLSERAKLSGELAQLRKRYDDNYPQIEEIKAQIAALDRQINKTSAEIKNSIRDAYLIAKRQEEGLKSELDRVARDSLDEQGRRVRFGLIERDASALRDQLEILLQRFNELSSAANIKTGTITIVDEATPPPAPVSPNFAKNMAVAFILAIGLAGGLAFLREMFDDRLYALDDVERKLGQRLLGQTPYVAADEIAEQVANPFSALMEAYASIHMAVDFALPDDHVVLQVTSSQAGEGKSTTALTLARKFAQLGRRTLLVDADLRRPALAAMLGVPKPDKGLVDVIMGRTELADVLIEQGEDNLDIVPVGVVPGNPVEILSSRALSDFITRTRKEYGIVIFDSSPVMGIADAPLLAHQVDATIYIAEASHVHFGQAKSALRRLKQADAKILGVVLTKYRALHAGQSYNYQYRYYNYGEHA